MSNNLLNNEITYMNNNNVSNSYQNEENEKSIMIDKYRIGSFLDQIK